MTNNDELALNADEIFSELITIRKNGECGRAILTWKEFDAVRAERDADKKVIADSVVLFETLRQRIAEQDARLIEYARIATESAYRVAELEARTVSVKLANIHKNWGERYLLASDVEQACAAAGIKLDVGEQS